MIVSLRTVMRRLAPYLLGCIWLLTACRSDTPAVGPGPTPPSSGTATPAPTTPPDPDTPIITQALIDGVPPASISIDQLSRQIRIRLPADYLPTRARVLFNLSGSAQAEPAVLTFELAQPCGLKPATVALTQTVSRKTNQYTVSIVKAQPPTLAAAPGPYNLIIGEAGALFIPINNLFPITEPLALRFRNQVNGEGYVVECAALPIAYQAGGAGVSVTTQALENLPPSRYSIELIRPELEASVSNQLLTLAKGPARLEQIGAYFPVVGVQQTVASLPGYNLYPGEIQVVLTGANGTNYLPIAEFAQNGRQMRLALEDNIRPGYYRLQLIQNERPLARCLRLAVTRFAGQPVIGSLAYDRDETCLFSNEPLVYARGQAQNLLFLGIDGQAATTYQARLVSVANPATEVLVPINTNVIETYPKLTLPTTTPPGRYRLSVRITRSGNVVESEPYERPIEVR